MGNLEAARLATIYAFACAGAAVCGMALGWAAMILWDRWRK